MLTFSSKACLDLSSEHKWNVGFEYETCLLVDWDKFRRRRNSQCGTFSSVVFLMLFGQSEQTRKTIRETNSIR